MKHQNSQTSGASLITLREIYNTNSREGTFKERNVDIDPLRIAYVADHEMNNGIPVESSVTIEIGDGSRSFTVRETRDEVTAKRDAVLGL